MHNENIRSLTDASASEQRELEYQARERKREKEKERNEINLLKKTRRSRFPNAGDAKTEGRSP